MQTQIMEGQLKGLKTIIEESSVKIKENKEIVSKIDRRINDLHHILELGSFNACQGYLISAEIRDILIAKREAKNNLSILMRNIGSLEKALKTTEKQIKNVEVELSTQKYHFREMTEENDKSLMSLIKTEKISNKKLRVNNKKRYH